MHIPLLHTSVVMPGSAIINVPPTLAAWQSDYTFQSEEVHVNTLPGIYASVEHCVRCMLHQSNH